MYDYETMTDQEIATNFVARTYCTPPNTCQVCLEDCFYRLSICTEENNAAKSNFLSSDLTQQPSCLVGMRANMDCKRRNNRVYKSSRPLYRPSRTRPPPLS